MRVLAARFRETGRASAVLEALQRQMNVGTPDVAIAPLAVLEQSDPNDIVLAGRFPDDAAPHVAELVRKAGGEIVADVDERWTRPRPVTTTMPSSVPTTSGFSRTSLNS